MKIKAAVLRTLKAPLSLEELTIPPLKKGQVLVKLAYSGICQSQLNEIKGYKGEDKFLPHTLGHEGSGVVLEIGSEVTKVKPGDHVVLSWIKGQGHDVPSSNYETVNSPCQKVNSGAISTFLECAVIAENRLIPISKNMPLREAALLGCALPTGAGVVFNEMKIQQGSSLALLGCGGIGLSALIAARFLNVYPLIAVDVNPIKLQLAEKCGATHTINASEVSVKEKVAEIMQELGLEMGLDYVLECAGKKEVMELAFQILKPKGACVLAGNLPKGQHISIDPFDLILGKKITGTWGGSSQIDRDVAYYTDLFINHSLPLHKMITHETSLDQINTLLTQIDEGHVGRGLIKF